MNLGMSGQCPNEVDQGDLLSAREAFKGMQKYLFDACYFQDKQLKLDGTALDIHTVSALVGFVIELSGLD